MGKQRSALVLAILLLLLIIGWWKLSSVHTPQSAPQNTAAQTRSVTDHQSISLPVIIHHSTVAGAHVYSGLLETPGTCQTISSGISATGQNPTHIILLVTATPQSGSCTTATSTSDFSVSFQSTDTKPPVLNGVMLNGTAVAYTLVENK